MERNRPTIATLVIAFLVTVINWLVDYLPDVIPTEVVTSGYALVVALLALAVGKIAQGELLGEWLGQTSPWAHQTHAAATAYALSLDPDVHGEERDLLLAKLGVEDERHALELIGVDPDDAA